MNDIIRTYQERFRNNRHAFRRYTALLLALAMITTLFVNWQLHGVGISMTADYQCGEIEHTHTAGCYTKVLVCGYEEGELENPDEVASAGSNDTTIDTGIDTGSSDFAVYEEPEPQIEWVPHEHTADCYTDVEVLTCMEEEHVHDDDCFDPEDGSLICEKFEHTHDESCYTTEQELTCGLEEGELVEQEVEPTLSAALFELAVAEPVAVELPADTVEPIYHHHTDACYEEELTCPFPEHHHTVNCLSDPYADIETEDDWLAKTDTTLDGLWSDDLLTVAQSQLGYEQSEKNFQLDGDDQSTVRYYTRYGDAYGNKYGEWDVMFLAYCLKYAQIPQTAVPQKAGVLALRSAMKDMDWFQDVDSAETAALDLVPGDIVLYKKAAARTIAVDTTQPDTVQSDTTTSIRGSHDSLISVLPADSSTAEPVDVGDFSPVLPTEPTTMTTTEWVDTVGIVEEVDAEAGTLTVIAGDVDGKVAEVPLSTSNIESMISLTAAQMALSEDGGAAVQPGNAATTTYQDYFEETPENSDKGGIYKYTISVKDIDQKNNAELTVGQTANLLFYYKIEAGVLSMTEPGKNVLHYTLPKGLEPPEEITRNVYDESGNKIGVQYFHTNGKSEIVFDTTQEYLDISKKFEGKFAYDWTYTKTTTGTDQVIQFPGDTTTITLKKQNDINIDKTASDIEEKDGKLIIHYTITVSSNNGWDKDDIFVDDTFSVTNWDTLNPPEIKNFTLQKFAADAQTGTDVANVSTPTFTKSNETNKWKFKVENLGKLGAGEKYVLKYDVELTNKSDKGWQSFGNSASTNDNKKSPDTWRNNSDHVQKSGKYDTNTGKVTWTVTVFNPFGVDLDGNVVKDTLASGTTDGNVTLTMTKDKNGSYVNDVQATFTPDTTGFTYKFDKTKVDTTGKEYTFVYTSNVPDGATRVSNDVDYTHGDSTYTAGGGVDITDNKWEPKKTKGSTALTLKSQDLYEAAWQIDADMPRSIKKVTITDKISPGYNAYNGSTSLGRMNHYAFAKDLQQQIEDNLTIRYTDTDGTEQTLHYNELSAKGIDLTIRYFTGNDANGSTVAADDAATKVQSFTIEIDTTNCKLQLKHLSLPYKTLVDTSGLSETAYVVVKNTANNSSAQYEYTKPSAAVRIEKGSWQSNNGRDYGKYGGTNKTASMNYAKNLVIGYQVILDLSSFDALNKTMTLTDTLPEGTTYVPNSTSVVFGVAGSITSGASNIWYQNLPTTDEGTYSTDGANANFFEPKDNGDGTLTFQWDWSKTKIDFAKLKQAGYTYLALRYKVNIANDTRWDSEKLETHPYENTITYENGVSATATTNVNRYRNKLDKSSRQITEKDGESRVRYTLVINPTGVELGTEDQITLTDKLTVMSPNIQASLDMNSVKLYRYPKKADSQPVDTNEYQVTAPVQSVDSNGRYIYTMTIKLNNKTPYVLEYDYTTNASAEVTLRNDATLTGNHTSYTEREYQAVGGSSQAFQKTLNIYKVSTRSDLDALQGAKFTLWKLDTTSGQWKELYTDLTTNKNGVISLPFTESLTDGKQEVTSGILYRLQETEAPQGYQRDESFRYFYYRNMEDTTIASDADAYNAAVGTCTGADIPTYGDTSLTCYHSDIAKNNIYVRNVPDNLIISKTWRDENDDELPADKAPLDEIKVDLYKCSENSTPNPATDTKVDTITLYKTDNWTYTYKGLEKGYRYYIVEQYSGTRFKVSYNTENTNGVGAGGMLKVTNKDTGQKEYELPSTGGTGTLPFTVAGGAMMLAALVYGIRRKRRYEGRAD